MMAKRLAVCSLLSGRMSFAAVVETIVSMFGLAVLHLNLTEVLRDEE